MKYLMGVDEGTTGCKAILFDECGAQIAATSREYLSYYPYPGWVEQDPEEWWSAICDGIKEVLKTVNAEDIAVQKKP